jgi:hypothetical protein
MTTYTWTTTGIRGDWATSAAWSPGSGPPGAGDVAIFGNLARNYSVNVAAADVVGVSTINIGPVSSSGLPTLSIAGSLTTGTLLYSTHATGPAARIMVNSGGLFDITTSLPAPARAETISVSGKRAGGHLELGTLSLGAVPNLTFDFSNNVGGLLNSGIIEFQSGYFVGAVANQRFTSVGRGDEFIIDGATFTGDTVTLDSTTHKLTVSDGTTIVFTMSDVNLANNTPNNFRIVGTNIIEAVCYARGTMIRTPDGELPVEKLRPGRQVVVLVDGQEVPQTVTWLGHRRIALANHPRPETVAPVHIQRDAFADGMPHRDLIVSPDHAIFVDGRLICARQLVNGTTIRQELDWTAVDYYHVELDRHAVLLAEGLPAESYIDTGNSGFFANAGAPLVLHPDLTDESGYPTREAGSCAPFVWDEASVRPLWQHLADRAAAIGRPAPERATTVDAGLRLVAKGRTVKPIYGDSDLVIFTLPRGAREVRLVSRAQSPTEARPWLEDRRRLGVRVARLVLRGGDEVHEVPVDHPDLATGWWAVERDGQAISRWTDGEAVLPLPSVRGNAMLEVHLAGAMTYVVDAATEGGTKRRAAA